MTADRLGVGVIGCGNVAVNFHLPGYRANGESFELVAESTSGDAEPVA